MEDVNLRDMIFDSARQTASLAPKDMQERETAPNMKKTGDFANTPFKGDAAFEREEPPKDHMRRYWRQYETTPILRESINSFAQQVIEPGYRIESEHLSDKQIKQLNKWLRKAAIIEKEPRNDIHHMLKKVIIQREVRGTALIEKVYAEEDTEKLYGLAFLNAETVRPNTRPGTPLLLLPDDQSRIKAKGELPKTENGAIAAYTQYTTSSGFNAEDPNSEDVNNYSLDDIIKLTRDADVNEAFGTSRIESCSDEIEGLKQKLSDQNEAIASKAYPLWLFMFGTEERPWDRQDIQRFMEAHEMENFHPGLKQGVRGDVDVETISGEVADIAEQLEFELDYVMSAMPLPKYALGSFETKNSEKVAEAQERSVKRQIKEARRELEAEFSEVVQQKARELFGIGGGENDKSEEIYFKIGRPGEEMDEEDPQTNKIKYQGKNETKEDRQRVIKDTSQPGQPPEKKSVPAPDDDGSGSESNADTVWDVDLSDDAALTPRTDGGTCVEGTCEADTASLADPRVVSTTDIEGDMVDLVARVFTQFRETLLQRLRTRYPNAPGTAAQSFDQIATEVRDQVLNKFSFTDEAEVLLRAAVSRTLDTLGQENQPVTVDVSFGYRHRTVVSKNAKDAHEATREALADLIDRMDMQISHAAAGDDTMDDILQRLETTYDTDSLRQRAQLLARMNIRQTVSETKLQEFEMHKDIVGVEVANPCGASTTQLCEELAGCGGGDPVVARLDSEKSLSEEWHEQVPDRLAHAGFDPVPSTPPFHYGCRSELVPLGEDELDEKLAEQPATSVEDLEAKYDMDLSDI